jgi:hypothetical protein
MPDARDRRVRVPQPPARSLSLNPEVLHDSVRFQRRTWGIAHIVSLALGISCVSIAMVENGIPVAHVVCNPLIDELILRSRETEVTYAEQGQDVEIG